MSNKTAENAQTVSHQCHVRVSFGECDPAGIVFFPNFYRWFDQATHDLCAAAGFSLIRVRDELEWVGYPIAEAGARFKRPASFDDQLTIETTVKEWRTKMFFLEHKVMRGDELLAEGWQTRFIGVHQTAGSKKLSALEIPQDFRDGMNKVFA